jgi:hypothetical protein
VRVIPPTHSYEVHFLDREYEIVWAPDMATAWYIGESCLGRVLFVRRFK